MQIPTRFSEYDTHLLRKINQIMIRVSLGRSFRRSTLRWERGRSIILLRNGKPAFSKLNQFGVNSNGI